MSRTNTLIVLGLLMILTPFSGLPISLRTVCAVIFGVSVVGIGLSDRAREIRRKQQKVSEAPEVVPQI